MDWIFPEGITEEDIKNFEGFVYVITNLTNNRKYIGKKFVYSYRTQKISGKKRKRKIKTESNWRDYTGSSDELNQDIRRLGKKNFQKEIIKLCKTKSETNYEEAAEQFRRKVLFTEEYYNKNILCKFFKRI